MNMLKTKEKFTCDICGQQDNFEVINVEEQVDIKGISFESEHIYYRCVHCKEEYEPFDNFDINYYTDYKKYRELTGLLQSDEIKRIREAYGISQRTFAKLLSISHATLSNIEKGSLQSPQHDILLRLASDPYSFYKNVFCIRKSLLSEGDIETLDTNLKRLIATSYDGHKKEMKEFKEIMSDKTNNLIRRVNHMEYEIKTIINIDAISNSRESGEGTWKKEGSNILTRVYQSLTL